MSEKLSPTSVSVKVDEKAQELETVVSLLAEDTEAFPEGGVHAWIVLVGTTSGFFATFGYVNSWGVFQAYYQEKLLHSSTPSEISWIGSIQVRVLRGEPAVPHRESPKHAMIFLPAVLVGHLFDIGYYRFPFLVGSLLVVLTTLLVPECKQYWHFMLCQGFGVGIGSGLMFCTMFTIVTHWFKRRRGFALGFTCFGGAIGATVQPIILRQLISKLGFPWAMRILAFILLLMLVVTNLSIKRRLAPNKTPGGLLGLQTYHNIPFVVFNICSFITGLGLFTMLTYISSSAIEFGISPNFAFYLVAIINFSSGIGRVTSGVLGDYYGPMNIMTIMTAIAGCATIAWPFCRTIARITGISVLYGFSSGAWLALIGSAVGQMGDIEDLGRRLGALNTVAGIATLCGPPISGLFVESRLGFISVGAFAGDALLVGACLIFVSRLFAAPGLWRKY
ncbi:MFS general substrate transporter [Favolaschia claudopus]|uniref:MFS general substrate transporter n=1 Tax=Favolaschia claudopus TaxID=2862362 RepID=A0AAW0D2T9_9AGAR